MHGLENVEEGNWIVQLIVASSVYVEIKPNLFKIMKMENRHTERNEMLLEGRL